MNDQLRFAIMSVVAATFPMLTLLGIVNLSAEQVAAITAFITQVMLLISLVWKNGQQEGPPMEIGTRSLPTDT